MEKVFGLLGHPVGHSMSPLIHNNAFLKLGIEARYHAFDVKPEFVKEAIDGIRALNISGCNVTVPHKIAVMDFLDEINDEALQIGAVNTIVNKDGKLIGYNTDGRGYVKSLLDETEEDIREKSVLIIGAGGGARGVVTALLRHGVGNIEFTNRTIEKTIPLVKLAKEFHVPSATIEKEVAEENLINYDVIINTTSVGMSPNIHHSPLSLKLLKTDTIVSDLIYNPLETKLLQEAKERGGKTVNGIGMFVNQAALSFEHWTGVKPDITQMKKNVLQQLGGTTC
ncbi:shikimate dehydrogenase [Halalkalibacter alkalisediminis]|uniref:Shikimate dehydrogenase (NADP(+)) n=1 Tax=Halalkalibacter alkalisediminis TaxID=935616 RepID=A0ABV6NBA1_9BACI|nr:shikimate dehydrogenase [Halalkalibacter alkalisediminis]